MTPIQNLASRWAALYATGTISPTSYELATCAPIDPIYDALGDLIYDRQCQGLDLVDIAEEVHVIVDSIHRLITAHEKEGSHR